MKTILTSVICLCIAGPLFAQTPANYHLVKKTVVGGEGGWDYLLADADGGRLYVSHGNQVEVLDPVRLLAIQPMADLTRPRCLT
jgi:hypothetical protein